MQKSIRNAAAGIAAAVSAVAAPIAARAGSALDNLNQNAQNTATGAFGTGATETDLATLVGNFISAALGLLGVVLVVLIIYAGFLWMTAQGNEEKVKTAKKIITNAVIGMVLIFAAYAITNFVIGSLATSIQG